jgi:hypothetical protein
VRTLLAEYNAAHGSCGTVGTHSTVLAIPHPRRATLTQAAKANTAQNVRLVVVAKGNTAYRRRSRTKSMTQGLRSVTMGIAMKEVRGYPGSGFSKNLSYGI